jgi:1-acyl-sn-glycerol-3-phosphate acyltransferase
MAELVYPPVVAAFKTVWKALGIRFTFVGDENIPENGGAIIASNHISYLDFALIGTPAVPKGRYIRFMAKKEIFDNPLAGPFMRAMKHISVDREKGSTSLVAAMRALRSGELVGIFPEATISLSWEVKELKSGAIRLAQGAGVPVIPVALWGSHRILTKAHKPSLGRKNYPITIAYGEPYMIDKGADVALEEDRLRQKIADLLHSIQETYPDSPVGTWWSSARLGGTAPTIEEAAIINARRKAERAEKKNKKMNKKKRASN